MAKRYVPRRQRRDDDMPGRKIDVERQFRSFVLYGRSGSGKTTLASTWPKPILYLDIKDRGTDSISDVEDIEPRELGETGDFEDMAYYLEKHPDRFATVVVDTVSQLQEMMIKEKMRGKTRKGKQAGDWGSMTRRDWGDVAAEMKKLLMMYRDLDTMHKVFIAQDRTFNFDEDGDMIEIDPEVGPALMPSVAKVLNASVDMIGNTFIRNQTTKQTVRGKIRKRDKIEYCLRIGPSPVYVTKVRKPRLIEAPSFIVNPTYEDIIDIIKGE